MEDFADRLAAMGFGGSRPEAECWRVTRIGPPQPPRPARQPLHPACRGVLAFWRDRLADRPGAASPYLVAPREHAVASPDG